jgi:hypothetical protein
LQEEPVSEDLEEAMQHNAPDNIGIDDLLYWRNGFITGAKWQKEHLWKPADGGDLPEYEREVVVFTQDFSNDAGIMRVAIGHRPNPEGCTGETRHYTPQCYDKGGWNIPSVKYWLDLPLPEEGGSDEQG